MEAERELARHATERSSTVHSGQEHDHAIRFLYGRVLARQPSDEELRWSRAFLSQATVERSELPHFAWLYGYGKWDEETKSLKGFQPMPVYGDRQWKLTAKLQDDKSTTLFLDENGGLPGPTNDHVVVRRWVAEFDGRVHVEGNLQHSVDKGDGVEGWIVRNGQEILGHWTLKNSKARTQVKEFEVEKGDTLDFVVGPNKEPESDGFKWTVQVHSVSDPSLVFRSKEHFSGNDLLREFSPMAQFAQALLATNEFCFVD